jgi:hypothetical protein
MTNQICDCAEAQEEHEHCTECDCILTSHESELLCRSCEERIAHEQSFYDKWQTIYDNDEQDLH